MRRRRNGIAILLALTLALQPVSFVWAQEETEADAQWEAAADTDLPEDFDAEEEIIPAADDASGFDAETDADGSDTETNAGGSDAEGTADLLLIEGLVEDPEETEADAALAPVMEELPLEDPDIAPDGAVTGTTTAPAAGGARKAARKAAASAAFSGVYGDQLSGLARQLYDEKVKHFVMKRSTSVWQPTFGEAESLCTFTAVCAKDASGHKTYEKNDDSAAAKEALLEAMQSAADAFKHDYPETFWFRTPGTYGLSFSADDWTEGEERLFHLALIRYEQIEAFPGAYALLDQVYAGMDSAAEAVLQAAAQDAEDTAGETATQDAGGTATPDADGTAAQVRVLRAILEYIDARATYDNAALAEAERLTGVEKTTKVKSVEDVFRIYTCAGLFTDAVSSGVVCEGYAKAFKVLCDRPEIGIPCVLLCGKNHMWNAVRLDGIWYLVDPTWCDTTSSISSYKYFLTYDSSRAGMTSANFSNSEHTTLFTLPALSTVCHAAAHKYGTDGAHACAWCAEELGEAYTLVSETISSCAQRAGRTFADEAGHTVTICTGQRDPNTHVFEEREVIAPTCTEAGYSVYACTACGAEEKREETPAAGHRFEAGEIFPPTCTEQGYTIYTCSACGEETIQDYTEPVDHVYVRKEVIAPTCTEMGYSVYACTMCGAEEIREKTKALAHSYSAYVVEPTTTAQGYTEHVCTRCGQSYKDTFTPQLLTRTPVFKKLKVTGKRTLQLTWKKAGSYRKYEVQIATSPDFSDAVTRTFKVKKSEGKRLTRTVRMKKNTRYYVRIRAVSGARHSAWSRVRTRKTKAE